MSDARCDLQRWPVAVTPCGGCLTATLAITIAGGIVNQRLYLNWECTDASLESIAAFVAALIPSSPTCRMRS